MSTATNTTEQLPRPAQETARGRRWPRDSFPLVSRRGDVGCLLVLSVSEPADIAQAWSDFWRAVEPMAAEQGGSECWTYPVASSVEHAWFFPWIHWPHVKRQLEELECGWELTQAGCRPDPAQLSPPESDPTRCTRLWSAIAHAVRSGPCGQVRVQHMGDRGEVIHGLGRVLAEHDVLVVVRNNEEVRGLVRALRESRVHSAADTERPARWITDGGRTAPRDVPVMGVISLHRYSTINREGWDVVVVADLESARSDTALLESARNPDSLYYAITPDHSEMDEEDQLRLRLATGPVIHDESQLVSLTQVTVLTMGPLEYPPVEPDSALDRKRKFIWRNHRRNAAIAKAAVAFREGDRIALSKMGLLHDSVEEMLGEEREPLRIAVLVEGVEHGRELLPLLPGWKLMDATDGMGDNADSSQLPLDSENAIVTRNRARRAGVAADVLFRGDATAADWGRDLGPHALIHRRQMVMVDVWDDFDDRAVRDFQTRLALCWRRGWNVADENPAQLSQGERGIR